MKSTPSVRTLKKLFLLIVGQDGDPQPLHEQRNPDGHPEGHEPVAELDGTAGSVRQGVDSINFRSDRKIFRPVFILHLWPKFYPKTA
jgi:hypothetical protein